MVHTYDDESVFDAQADTIWNYPNAPEPHGPGHKSGRNRPVKPLGPVSIEHSQEQNIGGQWHKVVNRITLSPPVGMAIEVIEGPWAGSKLFRHYSPKGKESGVTVVGEFTSKVIPHARLEPDVRKFLEDAFNDDHATPREFGKKG